jgi:hypothetical protein
MRGLAQAAVWLFFIALILCAPGPHAAILSTVIAILTWERLFA